ncbi:MAG: hypothetical protein AVDCRST_MAG73-68 [uncultured Thermomicrobiales bacterium]|uniref:Uncharacterized protein n=1 Tax=uncultured Thermomicrobiales bacterium TaxID=1645740 RepID=A0A6J4TBE9_9BACT|nr:MAG: hypothetical protein AVDCRST_MAG73-68 [uncultured Thermomicrobiales bacterium]
MRCYAAAIVPPAARTGRPRRRAWGVRSELAGRLGLTG